MLHDVGKIGTPDRILNKPGPLTAEEYEVIKQHPVKGWEIARDATLEEEAIWILHHHERIDGKGYPQGLAGDQIPLEARIILVADAVEAITSDRPYRKGRDTESALAEMETNAGTQFDTAIIAALSAVLGRAEVAEPQRAAAGREAVPPAVDPLPAG
jgi:HD-GYP domain-containing protein (c-di-GMP phosphodiesterase class II)